MPDNIENVPTAVPLREHLEKYLNYVWTNHMREHERLMEDKQRAHDEIDRRLEAKTESMELRMKSEIEGVNRQLNSMIAFREQLVHQAANFITREHLNALSESYVVRINALENWKAGVEGRFWALGIGFGIFTLIVNIAARYLFPTVALH